MAGQTGLGPKTSLRLQALNASKVSASKCAVSPQPTSAKPSGDHSSRLIAAMTHVPGASCGRLAHPEGWRRGRERPARRRGHQGNGLARVAGGQGVGGGGDTLKELHQGFPALGREMRGAPAPALVSLGAQLSTRQKKDALQASGRCQAAARLGVPDFERPVRSCVSCAKANMLASALLTDSEVGNAF